MKSKPRSFALTDEGYEALRCLEKHLPFLKRKRGKLVSLALQNMKQHVWGKEPIKPVQLRHPDPAFLKFLDNGIWQLIELTRELREHLAQSENLDCAPEMMSCYIDALENLKILRQGLEDLAPIMKNITSKDVHQVKKFIEIARAIQSDKNSDPELLDVYRVASRILEPLVRP
jgi:hypothetical protein